MHGKAEEKYVRKLASGMYTPSVSHVCARVGSRMEMQGSSTQVCTPLRFTHMCSCTQGQERTLPETCVYKTLYSRALSCQPKCDIIYLTCGFK